MAGDSVLAVFGTAAGAVSAALAIQAQFNQRTDAEPEIRRMRFRIGVHLGDVIEKSDGTVYGDGVNIAARLQALAEPGGVMVSDAIHSAVRGRIDAAWADAGEQSVKNIAYPVHSYRAETGAAPALPATSAPEPRGRPSIAVLPFKVLSEDPRLGFLAEDQMKAPLSLSQILTHRVDPNLVSHSRRRNDARTTRETDRRIALLRYAAPARTKEPAVVFFRSTMATCNITCGARSLGLKTIDREGTEFNATPRAKSPPSPSPATVLDSTRR